MVIPSTGSWNDTIPTIPANVVELGHDKRFILAKRNELKRRNPDDPNDPYMLPDPGVFDYWILDTRTPIVYGPFTLDEYTAKRTELGVPNRIKLKDVNAYRSFIPFVGMFIVCLCFLGSVMSWIWFLIHKRWLKALASFLLASLLYFLFFRL